MTLELNSLNTQCILSTQMCKSSPAQVSACRLDGHVKIGMSFEATTMKTSNTVMLCNVNSKEFGNIRKRYAFFDFY